MAEIDDDWYEFNHPGYGVRRKRLSLPQLNYNGVGIIVEDSAGDDKLRLMIDAEKDGSWYTTNLVLSDEEVLWLITALYEVSLER